MRRQFFSKRGAELVKGYRPGGRNPGFWAMGRGELWGPYLKLVAGGRAPKAAAAAVLKR